jgi:predicted metalloprotease with PDZ domain
MKQMKYALLTFILFFTLSLSARNNYQFSVDLNSCVDDKLTIELITPSIHTSEIIYRLPKMVPGTYQIYDFGRFVSDFKVTDSLGNVLPIELLDKNSWKISSAQKLYKITYKVEDSWDSEIGTPFIFEPAGSNFEAGKNFVLNTHCLFGYFEGMTHTPYQINIIHPTNFYGSCSLTDVTSKENTDTYKVPNYMQLQDAPMMYDVPDTTMLSIGGAQILISVYSPNKVTTSKFIAENILEILKAQQAYLGGSLPIRKYVYLIYLNPGKSGSGASGALEHSYSSMYFLPEMDQKYLAQTIKNVSSHEFFHIVTPLSIHAEQIGDFDYSNPKMSEHLWLYEGCTEYAAGLVQVKYGQMPVDEYLQIIENKISGARKYNDSLPFTTMSSGCLDKYKDEYTNVYQKGALIGMCLDIKLRALSDGKYGIQELMKDLSKTYGKDKSFKDDELFDQIVKLTYPEIGMFFKRYIAGSESLPIKETLALAGIEQGGVSEGKKISFGGFSIGVSAATNRLTIFNTSSMDDFGIVVGYRENDELVKFNGKRITVKNIQQVIWDYLNESKEGGILKVVVLRKKTENSKPKKVKLSAKIFAVADDNKQGLKLSTNASPQQIKIREAWIGKH